ncbi:MAG: RagB/SusD family nutrient uptake outer membrane protein [Bacteroidales bacterium]|nr:RagB/SusD family nutrient uptake outer membrane protein [Bacteroidales bacterium]
MKKYSLKITVILMLMAIMLASCGKDFLNPPQTDAVDDQIAFRVPTDLVTGMHGVYHSMTRVGFMGRNVVLFGDIPADKINKMAAGDMTFQTIEAYNFTDNDGNLLSTWATGYQIINNSMRVIDEGNRMLNDGGPWSAADISLMHTQIAEAHALRAFALFKLVNIFGLPHSTPTHDNTGTMGIVAEDRFIFSDESVQRSSVGDAYDLILASIERAKTHFALGNRSFRPFYMNYAAVHALEARVNLYMRNWQGAITSANAALQASNAVIEMNQDRFIAMWGEPAATHEDIFSLSINAAIALAASSLTAFYDVSGGSINHSFYYEFDSLDMRRGLFVRHTTVDPNFWRPMKFPNPARINNTRVFGAPEMYLIIAEAETELGTNLDAARTALFQVAQRNPAFTTVGDLLPYTNSQADLRTFVAEERARELFQEGHRFFDIRRTGVLMTRPTGETRLNIVDWDASRFVFPIPYAEINVPGNRVIQTPNWTANLPR